MYRVLFRTGILFILAMAPSIAPAANEKIPTCSSNDRDCMMRQIEALTPDIERQEWQDQTYRELAKTYAYDGKTDKAIALIDKIKNPDTKAMTIRGIGMAIASNVARMDDMDKAMAQPGAPAGSTRASRQQFAATITALKEKAAAIQHGPSQGIAYTYIAMSQAFAGDDDGARATAASMTNAALQSKAYAETAEIEAERGDFANAMKSLSFIQASSFRNKAYDTVSRIFVEKAMIDPAYESASKIDNAYLRSKALQRILNKGNPEEEAVEPSTLMAEPAE